MTLPVSTKLSSKIFLLNRAVSAEQKLREAEKKIAWLQLELAKANRLEEGLLATGEKLAEEK